MSLLNRLRPKWQNSDPDVRIDAVRQLDRDDVELLTAVAQQDTDARVRKLALKKLDSPRLLLEIAETDTDEGVRSAASQRARQLLVQIACDSRDEDESGRALELLTDASDIASVAEHAHYESVRESAFDSLEDDEALESLIRQAKDPKLRSRALNRIEGPESLKNIALGDTSGELGPVALGRIDDVGVLEVIADHGAAPKPIRRQAATKLAKLAPEDHPLKVQERERGFQELCHRAESIDDVSSQALDELKKIESEWSELATRGPASDELSERFAAAAEGIRERSRKTAPSVEPRPEPDASATPTDSAPAPGSAAIELIERVATLKGDGLDEALRSLRDEWDRLEAKSEDLERRFRDAVKATKKRLEGLAKLEARKQELETLLAETEAASKGEDSDALARAFSKLAKKWRQLESVADADTKARYAHLEERTHEIQESKRRELAAQEQKTLSDIQALMTRLGKLTDSKDLSIREADKTLRAAQDLLKTMGPLPRSVNRKKVRRELADAREKLFKKTQDTRTIEDWKRWANADIQTSLIARIEALRDSEDIPKVAKEMRVIHEEWKKAGAAPAEKAEELWQRYKSVRDELRARCDKFFDEQKKRRRENLEKKRALCEEVEALADSEDWNKTADAIKAIQEKWKTIGPAPRKDSDAVWQRFRQACDRFFERRKAHFDELKGEREENLAKKIALCEKAEALQDSMDWRTTADELKRLQAEWRTIGAVPRKKSDQVWKRFRKACDHFFERYKRRDEVELEDKLKRREAVAEEAEAFAKALPDDPVAVADKAKELWSTWKRLGTLPDSKRELQERFDSTMSKIVERSPDAFSDTDLDPVSSRKKRERLVTRLEKLVNDLTTTKSDGPVNELEDLAKRLEDALASNTITGGKRRDKKLDWRVASEEVRRLKANWLRTPPVPGEEGRALGQRFEAAYQSFLDHKP